MTETIVMFTMGAGKSRNCLCSSAFTMMLSHVLTEAGTPPSSVTTECDATLKVGTGFTLITIRVQAAVPGITEEELRRAAATAEQRCPVSKALSAIPSNVQTVLV
ncbi:OsmC family protein [Streptomyces sp. NPDC050528]|uniref:OsmC family protein n=1 Tax=Streptomyces sp. NPDC050528 TaxID=3365623 RepID=UPI003799AEDE